MNFIRNRNFRAGPQTSLEGFICPQNSDKQQKIKVFGRSGADYSIVNRLKKVLFPFWFIVVLAAPFLLLYDDISWYDVVTDSLLLTSKMNGSWWFMQTYVIFVICFPIFAKSLHYKMVCIPLLIASVLCFQPIATDIRKYSDVCIMFCIIFLFFTLV